MKTAHLIKISLVILALFMANGMHPAKATSNEDNVKIYLAFFGNPGCPPCDEDWSKITQLAQEYPNFKVRRFDFLSKENVKLWESLCKSYGVPEDDIRDAKSGAFVGDNYLLELEITEERIQSLISKYSATGTKPPWNAVEPGKEGLVERFKRWSVFAVIVAGLADGVNPCAFAVFVLFISYLAYLGKKQRKIVLAGLSFILAVFTTYLLVGIGILLFMRRLAIYSTVSHILNVSIGILAIILGSVSLYDYYLSRKGKLESMKLQLPRSIKDQIHRFVRKTKGSKFLIPFSFATGIVISLFELGCTGQIYLPTIAFVVGDPGMQAQALGYLLLYNFMFIVPLLAVFALVGMGVQSQKLASITQKHTGKTKLLIATILFVLGGLLLMLG